MVICEVKGKMRKYVNFYYNKKSRSHLTTFFDTDFNTIVRFLLDLKREGFPIDKAVREYLKRVEQEDWLF